MLESLGYIVIIILYFKIYILKQLSNLTRLYKLTYDLLTWNLIKVRFEIELSKKLT